MRISDWSSDVCSSDLFASEDIGLADPQALIQCLAAKDAFQFLGSPEGELAIVQACLDCATAPKSNAAYAAQKAAWAEARDTGSLAPPANILNAPTKLLTRSGEHTTEFQSLRRSAHAVS